VVEKTIFRGWESPAYVVENMVENVVENMVENVVENMVENVVENVVENMVENVVENMVAKWWWPSGGGQVVPGPGAGTRIDLLEASPSKLIF